MYHKFFLYTHFRSTLLTKAVGKKWKTHKTRKGIFHQSIYLQGPHESPPHSRKQDYSLTMPRLLFFFDNFLFFLTMPRHPPVPLIHQHRLQTLHLELLHG